MSAGIALRHVAPVGRQEMIPAVAREIRVCAVCGRKLSAPVSVKRGYGPTCAAKVGVGVPDDEGDDENENE